MSSDIREPIFWTSTSPGYNDPDRRRVTRKDGELIIERVPQRGHSGDHDWTDRRPAQGVRYVDMVKSDGHIVAVVLTNAAAHMDPTTPYGQHIMAKGRFFGWFQPSACPCAIISNGSLKRDQFASPQVRNGTPCAPGTYSAKEPCPHAAAEIEARRAKHAAKEAEREANYKSKEDKILDGQREQTEALVAAQRQVAELLQTSPPRSRKSEEK